MTLSDLFKSDGRSQPVLAALSGIPQQTISRIISGESIPRADTMVKLLSAMGLSDRKIGQVLRATYCEEKEK